MSSFFIGVDLGQKNDPTAVAVLQRFVQQRAHQSPLLHSLHVRHVERLPLGAPYPRVVERIREIVQHDHLAGDCSLAVDATGLGAPVVDMLRGARLSCDISPVNITGGDRQSRSGKTWNVPKRDLLASLQLPLEHGQLKLAPGLKLMASLIREFTDFRSTTNSCWRAQRREVSGDGPDRPFNSRNMYNSVEDYDPGLRFHTRR